MVKAGAGGVGGCIVQLLELMGQAALIAWRGELQPRSVAHPDDDICGCVHVQTHIHIYVLMYVFI